MKTSIVLCVATLGLAGVWGSLPGSVQAEVTDIGENDFRISDMGSDGDTFWYYYGGSPSVAYNPLNQEYLVVWQGREGPEGSEIHGQRIDIATGAALGENDFRISDMGADGNPNTFAESPAVAYSSASHEYLVVWHGLDDIYEGMEIFGQRLNASTGGEVGENDFLIRNISGFPDRTGAILPALAYNSVADEYIVVWFDGYRCSSYTDYALYGQRLDGATAAQVGTDDFHISNRGPYSQYWPVAGPHSGPPAVAYSPTQNEYFVAWSGDGLCASSPPVWGEHELFGQLIDAASGAEVGAEDLIFNNVGTRPILPAVAHNPQTSEYLLVWQASVGVSGSEIYGQRIDAASGLEVGGNDFRISSLGAASEDPSATYSPAAEEYLVVWRSDDPLAGLASGEFEILGQRLEGSTAEEKGVIDFRISDMGPDGTPDFKAGAPEVVASEATGDYLVVWGGDDSIPPLVDDEFEVFGQRLAIEVNVPPVALCHDMNLVAGLGVCVADVSIDDGSYDPDGSSILLTQDPPGPYALGVTSVALTASDGFLEDECLATVTVVDQSEPIAWCNAPLTITPPDPPVFYTATATDNCGVATLLVRNPFCSRVNSVGKPVPISCRLAIENATITVQNSGGVGTIIGWEVLAEDAGANATLMNCQVEVVNPGQGR